MRRRRFGLAGVTVLAGLLLSLVAIPAAAAQKYAEVELIYDADSGTCSADPDPVQVFWNKKPKKVKWVSVASTDLYWDIVWKGDGKNYFNGNFDIKCGKDVKKSTLPSGKDKDGATWGYTISAYTCLAGQQKGELVCEVDPVVDWDP